MAVNYSNVVKLVDRLVKVGKDNVDFRPSSVVRAYSTGMRQSNYDTFMYPEKETIFNRLLEIEIATEFALQVLYDNQMY